MNHGSAGGSVCSSPRSVFGQQTQPCCGRAAGSEQGSAQALLAKACIQSSTCLPIWAQQCNTSAHVQPTSCHVLVRWMHLHGFLACSLLQPTDRARHKLPRCTRGYWAPANTLLSQLQLAVSSRHGKTGLLPPALGTHPSCLQSGGGMALQAPWQ